MNVEFQDLHWQSVSRTQLLAQELWLSRLQSAKRQSTRSLGQCTGRWRSRIAPSERVLAAFACEWDAQSILLA